MNPLHAAFNSNNLKAFRQLLDRTPSSVASTGSSGSAPRSWTLSSTLSAPPVDVNAKDHLGRTVLHRACSGLESTSVDYVPMLMSHSSLNVNVQDTESHWTALHRALYVGNIPAAILLLQHSDIDISLKDYDGYTAFELYNSTVGNTRPNGNETCFELYTWGANRNAALGLGDSNDRSYPEMVSIPHQTTNEEQRLTGSARFYPVPVKGIEMSKLHTVVVVAEKRANLRLCGFGSGGRLGAGVTAAQYGLAPLSGALNIVSVACGPDHTLALTNQGDVLSWGMNRFCQLGYVVEAAAPLKIQRLDQQCQPIPRKITGALKGKTVLGVAACRTASAAWTKSIVYTWGTNGGQLGYSEQVQIFPRAVSTLADPVMGVTITDVAMACLMETGDVICFANTIHFKIGFSMNTFPSGLAAAYRPPHSIKRPAIKKITSYDCTFAALSEFGDVYTFTITSANQATGDGQSHTPPAKERGLGVKPQRVWSSRKEMEAVSDVSMSSDGSLIICTVAGQVYVRTRASKGSRQQANSVFGISNAQPNKLFKFQRVPYLQRVVKICANGIGSFAALREEAKLGPITVSGTRLHEDMNMIRPFILHYLHRGLYIDDATDIANLGEKATTIRSGCVVHVGLDDEDDDTAGLVVIGQNIETLSQLLGVLGAAQHAENLPRMEELWRAHGADAIVHCVVDIPVHRVILVSRCSALAGVFRGSPLEDLVNGIRINAEASAQRINIAGVHTLTILVLLHYFYTDIIPAFWNPVVTNATASLLSASHVNPFTIKSQLQILARLLHLTPLVEALHSISTSSPKPTLSLDMATLFTSAQETLSSARVGEFSCPTIHDVVIELADKRVACHSAILRARSPFFSAFLGDEDWTSGRWKDGILEVNLKHLEWKPMSFVFKFMYQDIETDMFDAIDFTDTIDDFLDFVFSVMACANELLLDRLVLVCSSIILRHVSTSNVTSLLAEADYYHAAQLVEKLQLFIAINAEYLLECRMLDELPSDVTAKLATFIRQQQDKKSPVSRSNEQVQAALDRNAAWLKEQDIAQPIIRSSKAILTTRPTTRMSPTNITLGGRAARPSPPTIPPSSPSLYRGVSDVPGGLFVMDEEISLPEPVAPQKANTSKGDPSEEIPSTGVWRSKATVTPKTDLRAIMAEAEKAQACADPTTKGKGRIVGFQPSPPRPVVSPVSPLRDVKKPWGNLADRSPGASNMTETSSPHASPSVFPFPSITGSWPPKAPAPSGSNAPPRQVGFNMTLPPSRPTVPTPSGPELGPIITPMRLPMGDGPGKRRVPKTLDAWNVPPIEPFPPPQSQAASNPSFAAIQQQQRAQSAHNEKPKRSLLDIQREEQEMQVEMDFLKWWTAEEERIRSQSIEERVGPDSGSTLKQRTKGGRRLGGGKLNTKKTTDELEQSVSTSSPISTSDQTTRRERKG